MEQRRYQWLGVVAAVFAIALVFALSASIVYANDDHEGEPSTAAAISTTASVPNVRVYRVFNPYSSEHLYTVSQTEVNALTKAGWSDEGIGWYAPREDGTPVYRLYNQSTGHHLYTDDTYEKTVLAAGGEWVVDYSDEPVFLSGGDVPIMRMYNPAGMHLITRDYNEYAHLPAVGWDPEGIKLAAESAPTTDVSYPTGAADISNTTSVASMQADVSLKGNGSGYQAKLVAEANGALVSFGLQYNAAAAAPYDGCTALLVENVKDATPAIQKFVYAGYGDTAKSYRLLIAVQSNGVVDCYINGVRVKSVRNDRLAGANVTLRVEGAGKAVGDQCNAQFSSLKLKKGGVYVGNGTEGWAPGSIVSVNGLRCDASQFPASVSISGDVVSLSAADSRVFGGSATVRFDAVAVPAPPAVPETPDSPADPEAPAAPADPETTDAAA